MKKSNAGPEVPKSTLELLRDEEADLKRKTEALEKELSSKLGEQEKLKAAAEERVATLRAELERMKAEYREVLTKVEAETREALMAKAVKLEDVKSGRTSLSKYYAEGLPDREIEAKARAQAETKTFELLQLIREKARALLGAEVEELRAENELYYLRTAPGMFWIQSLKEFMKNAESKVSAILGGWPLCRTKLDERKRQLEIANDSGLAEGEIWRDLNREALEALRFSPLVPEEYLVDLQKAIENLADGGNLSMKIIYQPKSRRGINFW